MKIEVIGGAGAFSCDNSSFLIEVRGKKILFDCGFNAFCKIKNSDSPDVVFISHTHFDHIAGLEQLIFYEKFSRKKDVKILCGKTVEKELKVILEDTCKVIKNSKLVIEKPPFIFIDGTFFKNDGIDLIVFETNHIIKTNYGLCIKDNKKRQALIVTGDTKACKEVRELVLYLSNEDFDIAIFHDFFDKDDRPDILPHCCKSDFLAFYGDIKDKAKWFLYHNDTFNEKYKGKILDPFSEISKPKT